MADNKVIFEVVATAKGFEIVNKQQKKLRNEIDKTSASEKKLDKQRDKGYGRQQQAMIQTANSTKNFSKLNQTIGGASGSGALVSTYALLAANVFAATAAFNALRNAAGIEKLAEGLTAFGNETGQSLDLVSAKLKEITGNAVSLEQAMRTAALSTSAGFGVAEMEGLTRVAKGASLALGRDMGDALDRLTRGAIKLEPEILDELGIMVRLDDAVETYAAQLGKAASGLTRFERQQAFMNAIITEGESKFGGIADSIQPNAYDNLSAAIADLSKNMLTLLNKALIPIINFFMSSPALFLGGILAMSGGITSRLIPAIGDLTEKSRLGAEQAKLTAQSFAEGADEQVRSAREVMTPTKESAKAYNELTDKLSKGTQTSRELGSAKSSLTKAINAETKAQEAQVAAGLKVSKQAKRELADMVKKRAALEDLTGAEISQSAARKVNLALADENFYDREADVLAEASRSTLGYKDSLAKLKTTFNLTRLAVVDYWKEVVVAEGYSKSASITTKILSVSMATLRASVKAATLSFKAFGTAILGALPFLGLIMIAFDLLKGALKAIAKLFGFFAEETEAANKAQKDLATVLDGISDKMSAYDKIVERSTATTKLLTAEFKILGGIAKTAFDEALKTQKALDKEGARNKGTDSDAADRATRFARAAVPQGAFDDNFIQNQLKNVDAFALSIDKMSRESDRVAAIVEKKFGKSYNTFAQEFLAAGNSAEDLAKVSRQTLVEVEKAVNGVSQSAEGLATALKEAEKEGGKFLRTFAVKSKYDALLSSLSGVNTELKGLIEQAKEGDADATQLIAESLLSLGPQVSLLAGSNLGKELDVVKEKSKELSIARQASLRAIGATEKANAERAIKSAEKELKTVQLRAAEIFKTELPGLVKKLAVLQEIEIAQKREVALIKQIQKGAQAASKDARVKLAASQLQIDILAVEEGAIRRQLDVNAETLRQAQLKLAAGAKEIELEETLRDALIQKRGAEERLQQIKEEQIRAATLSHEITLEEVKTAQQLFNLQKELTTLTLDGAEKRNKINKFRLGENLQTNAKEAAQAFEIAQKRIEMSKLEAEIKFSVIEAEHALLKARVATEKDLIQARIESIRQENTLSSTLGQASITGTLRGRQKTIEGPSIGGDVALEEKLRGLAKIPNLDPAVAAEYIALADKVAARIEASITTPEVTRLENLANALGDSVDVGEKSLELSRKILDKTIGNLDFDLSIAAQTFSKNLGDNLLSQAGGGSALATALSTTTTSLMEDAIEKLKEQSAEETDPDKKKEIDEKIASATARLEEFKGGLGQAAETMQVLANISRSIFGEDGILISGIAQFSASFVGAFDTFSTNFEAATTKSEELAAKLELAGNITAAFGALSQAAGQAKVAEVDQAIEAEKKRDGKSKESLAKIAALEKKKDAMAKKAFERNKKIQMAQTIINTASAIVAVLDDVPAPYNFALAALVGAMGAAQLGMIAKTQYQSTASGDVASPTTALNIGSRSNAVDVGQRASGGELSYLRGERGVGTNANNFTPGGAMGRKGYANGADAVVVGERGPELITPSAPVDITPNYAMGGGETNINFNISAVDGASVQNMLNEQQGNIIAMIREAANDNGEGFLESVDPTVYGGSG